MVGPTHKGYPRTLNFTAEQFSCLLGEVPELTWLRSKVVGNHAIEVSSSEETLLLEAVANQLQKRGFDQQYSPTHRGELLESIIDVVTAHR